jgi:hypothetical protein
LTRITGVAVGKSRKHAQISQKENHKESERNYQKCYFLIIGDMWHEVVSSSMPEQLRKLSLAECALSTSGFMFCCDRKVGTLIPSVIGMGIRQG